MRGDAQRQIASPPMLDGPAGDSHCPQRRGVALVAIKKPFVRYGAAQLLANAGFAGQIYMCSDDVELRAQMTSLPVTLLLADDSALAWLAKMQIAPSPLLKTILLTAQHHVSQPPSGVPGQLCGMLSESSNEAQLHERLKAAIQCLLQPEQPSRCAGCILPATLAPAQLPLSPREREIFERIGRGIGPTRISAELGLSVKTVECYRDKIKQKLQLTSRDALLLAAVQWQRGYCIEREMVDLVDA